jgi:hypothetical protein
MSECLWQKLQDNFGVSVILELTWRALRTIQLSVVMFINLDFVYSLRTGRSWDPIPVGMRFFAPVQTDPGSHPASYTMGTGSFPGVKRSGRDVDQSPHLAPRLKEE